MYTITCIILCKALCFHAYVMNTFENTPETCSELNLSLDSCVWYCVKPCTFTLMPWLSVLNLVSCSNVFERPCHTHVLSLPTPGIVHVSQKPYSHLLFYNRIIILVFIQAIFRINNSNFMHQATQSAFCTTSHQPKRVGACKVLDHQGHSVTVQGRVIGVEKQK